MHTLNPLSLAATITLALTAGGITLTAASQAQSSAATQSPAERGFSISLERGEVLQIFAPEAAEEGANARREFYQSVIPIVEGFGFQRLGQLNVSQRVISDYNPGAFIFFSWPNLAASQRIEATPEWPSIQATRREGWDELKIYGLVLEENLNLQFDPDKHYTVVVAWLDEENASGYSRYLEGIEPAVERAGGRFIYKMRGPMIETIASEPVAPGQITFVEWESTDGFDRVQQSPEYRAHQQYFGSSVERFEFYWLEVGG